MHSSNADSEPQKKKQRRNKPTLSCEGCAERKTKVGLIVKIYVLWPCCSVPEMIIFTSYATRECLLMLVCSVIEAVLNV